MDFQYSKHLQCNQMSYKLIFACRMRRTPFKHNFKITGEVNNNLVMLQCSSGKLWDLAFTWISQHSLLKAKDAHHGYSGIKCLQQDKVSANGQKKGSGPTSTTTAKATQPLNSPSKLEK